MKKSKQNKLFFKKNPLSKSNSANNLEVGSTKPTSTSKSIIIIKNILKYLFGFIVLVIVYIFLLVIEPIPEKQVPLVKEENISIPMSAIESPGETSLQFLADSFTKPIISMKSNATMQHSIIYDTEFNGNYARILSITYSLQDGSTIKLDNVRPTNALTLLGKDGFSLEANKLYSIAGLSAAKMQNNNEIFIFAQNDEVAYGLSFKSSTALSIEEILSTIQIITPATMQ